MACETEQKSPFALLASNLPLALPCPASPICIRIPSPRRVYVLTYVLFRVSVVKFTHVWEPQALACQRGTVCGSRGVHPSSCHRFCSSVRLFFVHPFVRPSVGSFVRTWIGRARGGCQDHLRNFGIVTFSFFLFFFSSVTFAFGLTSGICCPSVH